MVSESLAKAVERVTTAQKIDAVKSTVKVARNTLPSNIDDWTTDQINQFIDLLEWVLDFEFLPGDYITKSQALLEVLEERLNASQA